MANSSQKFERGDVPPEIAPEMKKLEEKIIAKQREFKELKEKEGTVQKEIISLKEEAVLKTPAPQIALEAIQGDVAAVSAFPSEKSKLEFLLKLVDEKGIYHATNVAKNLNNPYLLDLFHDQLINNFYDALIQKGKLKPL